MSTQAATAYRDVNTAQPAPTGTPPQIMGLIKTFQCSLVRYTRLSPLIRLR